MKIAVIGKTGQLARAIAEVISKSPHQAQFFDRSSIDLSSSKDELASSLTSLIDHKAIILAAAYTQVDQAEADFETANAVNAYSPGMVASFCEQHGIALVHVSTDYVFSGDAASPYCENDPVAPINAYGKSKFAGETAILETKANAAILRTSWVFDGLGKNFLTTMLRLGETRAELNVVSDQIGRPTFAGHLAEACVATAEALVKGNPEAKGVFHVSGSGEAISWADFARAIFKEAHHDWPPKVTVHDITTSQYPTPAKRPAYSVLDISHFENTIGYKMPDWRIGLRAALAQRES